MTRDERQLEAIEKWKQAKGKATIVAATGFGKTHCAMLAIERVTTVNPHLIVRIIVPTKVLKDQWVEIIERSQLDIDIKVIVLKTAASKPFKCDFLVIDELHRAAGLKMAQVFQNCNPALILGLTATYERLDGREKIVLDHYCPVCDTITLKEATENNWLAPYKEYKVLLDVDLTPYNQANQEFMQHFAFFDYNFKLALDCSTNLFAQIALSKQYNCDLKEVKAHAFAWNRALQFRKSFIANHPHKIEIAKKIIEARKDKKIITFNTSINQCRAFGTGYIIHSQNSKQQNKAIIEEFAHCTTGQIHSSKMLLEGLDCPGLSVAIITGFTSSKTAHTQTLGRTIRFEPGKEAEIFTLVLRNTVEEQWSKKSTEGLNYIEINEQELESILNHQQIINKQEKTQEKINNTLLRF